MTKRSSTCPLAQKVGEAVKLRIELADDACGQSQALLALALDKIAGFQTQEKHILRAAVSRALELSKAAQYLLCNDDVGMPRAEVEMTHAMVVVQHG